MVTTDRSTNGQPAAPDAELIDSSERELVLQAWEELKQRGDGELRVAVKRQPDGRIEIIYIGVHQKANLEALRRLYNRLRQQKPVTFGRR